MHSMNQNPRHWSRSKESQLGFGYHPIVILPCLFSWMFLQTLRCYPFHLIAHFHVLSLWNSKWIAILFILNSQTEKCLACSGYLINIGWTNEKIASYDMQSYQSSTCRTRTKSQVSNFSIPKVVVVCFDVVVVFVLYLPENIA